MNTNFIYSFDFVVMAIFGIALLGIILMLILKRLEIKSGKKSLFSRMGERTDHIFRAGYAHVRRTIRYVNRQTFIALMQWIAMHVLSSLRNAYIWAYRLAHRHPHSKKVIDMVRGKGEVQKGTAASFYLKQIREETTEWVDNAAHAISPKQQTVAQEAKK